MKCQKVEFEMTPGFKPFTVLIKCVACTIKGTFDLN